MSLGLFLTTVVDALEEAGVSYMLTGSLAAAYYASPRATQDVDFVVDPDEPGLAALVDGLTRRGLYVSADAAREALQSGGQFNAIHPSTGWKADLIIRRERPFSIAEFERRRSTRILGVDVPMTTVEDLLLAKLEWSQLGDSDLQRRDVIQLLESVRDSVDRRYLEDWVDRLGLRAAWQDLLDRLPGGETDSELA